tara:strand:+ start:11642 stop:12253 length:612 start_codon:yes stop_codon:yes gene_type:complete
MVHLEEEASEIGIAGDSVLVQAVQRGRESYRPFKPQTEAEAKGYKLGLDLFLGDNGIKDLVAVDQIVSGDMNFQKGFFEKFNQWMHYLSEGDDLHSVYNRIADGYMKSCRNGSIPESEYMSFLNGSLLASEVVINCVNSLVEDGIVVGDLQDQLLLDKRTLFDRKDNPTKFGTTDHLRQMFSEEEVTGLLDLKYRMLSGELNN